MRLVVRVLVVAAALAVAAWLVPGFEVRGTTSQRVATLVVLSLVVGVVNATLGRVLKLLALPVTVMTLGLFLLVLNAVLLKVSIAIAHGIGRDISLRGFGSAVEAALLVTIASWLITMLLPDRLKRD